MNLTTDWSHLLHCELQKDYFLQLTMFIEDAYTHKTIYPKYDDIFRAFNLVKVENVKVIIIGQDPYHGPNQANGLAFSVYKGIKTPPSLRNIYKELVTDIGCTLPENGDLTSWARQGVFLINSVLTVEKAKPNSHQKKGWEEFTNAVIETLSREKESLVFILWGGPSQKKEILIDTDKHLVLKAPHPSPLSAYRGFFGSKPFSKTNEYLKKHSKESIQWCLDNTSSLF